MNEYFKEEFIRLLTLFNINAEQVMHLMKDAIGDAHLHVMTHGEHEEWTNHVEYQQRQLQLEYEEQEMQRIYEEQMNGIDSNPYNISHIIKSLFKLEINDANCEIDITKGVLWDIDNLNEYKFLPLSQGEFESMNLEQTRNAIIQFINPFKKSIQERLPW
jgi:hypothetical protein